MRQKACAFYSAVDYIKALRLCMVLMEEIRRAFEVCDEVPPSNPAPRLDDDATLPGAASKPAATPEPDTFDLGKPFDEATLFRVSHAYESATDWHTRRSARWRRSCGQTCVAEICVSRRMNL